MPTITIEKIYHNDKTKDGKPYMSKQGKPYTRCSIMCKDKTGQDQWLSGFGNQTTKSWSIGDSVEVEIERSGEFLNFSIPKPEFALKSDLESLKMRVARLEGAGGFNDHVQEAVKAFDGEVVPQTDHKEVRVEDIPF